MMERICEEVWVGQTLCICAHVSTIETRQKEKSHARNLMISHVRDSLENGFVRRLHVCGRVYVL